MGPWYKVGSALDGEFEFIWERGKNEKVTLVSFPTARTESIGGTYMRGFRSSHRWRISNFEFSGKYVYQEALNASEINWQKGMPIPGRPVHELAFGGDYEIGSWLFGLGYSLKKDIAVDLVGETFRESDSDLSAKVRWQTKGLYLQLYGNGLLAKQIQPTDFLGTTPSGILEPALKQRILGLEVELEL